MPVSVEITHFYEGAPADVDNIIKPILDSIKGFVYIDDRLVSDVVSRRRPLTGPYVADALSPALADGIAGNLEFLHIRIAEARVESRPGWKFIVVSPGEVRRGAPGPVLNDLSEAQINGLLVQVGELRASRHLTAALAMAWSALEASMRRAAEANEIPLRRPDTLELMRELVSNGVLERNRYREISEAFRLRSAVAHGCDAPDTVNLGNVLNLLETTTRELLIERAEPGPA